MTKGCERKVITLRISENCSEPVHILCLLPNDTTVGLSPMVALLPLELDGTSSNHETHTFGVLFSFSQALQHLAACASRAPLEPQTLQCFTHAPLGADSTPLGEASK